ncbi:hypothetical protein V6N13_135039 [Hibiscus sabdariffa]
MHVLLRIAIVRGTSAMLDSDVVSWDCSSNKGLSIKSAYSIRSSSAFCPHDVVWQLIHNYRGLQPANEDIAHLLRLCLIALLTWERLVRSESLWNSCRWIFGMDPCKLV